MNSDLPKVLHKVCGKPMILYVLDSLKKAGVSRIIVVVGYKGEQVLEVLPSDVLHVWQYEQLGTGHAVMQAEEVLAGFDGNVAVACGDVPLIRHETFSSLFSAAEEEGAGASVLTMKADDPFGYGRIIKDKDGNFIRIVEEKDADEAQKLITEVNTGTYVFDRKLLFEGLKGLDTNNSQKEYYLTDALGRIAESGRKVKTLVLTDPVEGSGVNRQEELEKLERYLKAGL